MTAIEAPQGVALEPHHLPELILPQPPREDVAGHLHVPLEDPALDVVREQHRRNLDALRGKHSRVRKVEDDDGRLPRRSAAQPWPPRPRNDRWRPTPAVDEATERTRLIRCASDPWSSGQCTNSSQTVDRSSR